MLGRVLGTVVLAAALAGCRRPDTGRTELRVGAVLPLTGSLAHLGLGMRDGIALAVEEANAAGGVGGRPVELRVHDSQGRAEEAVACATRLVHAEHVSVVIGEAASSNTLAMAPVIARAEVPLLSPSTSPRVTAEGGAYVFRTNFTDTFQGAALARFGWQTLGRRRMAVLADERSAYSQGLAQAFADRFRTLGGTVVREAYAQGDTDFRAQLTRLRAQHPDALFVPGYYSDVGVIARQAREIGLLVPLLGGDGWDGAERLTELGGSALQGSRYASAFSPDDPAPRVQRFVAKWEHRFGAQPDSSGALGYDAGLVTLDALRRARTPTGPAIRDALAATRDLEGATGRFSFDAERNLIKSLVMLEIADGRRRFLTEISP